MTKTTEALDPRGVIPATHYTIALSEVDVQSAVEPSADINNQCSLWTPDTHYVDWAELAVQVNKQAPLTGECVLNDANGNSSAGQGTVLTKCGTSALQNGNLFSEGQPLAINFDVTDPNDTVTVGLALDNVGAGAQNALGAMSQPINGIALAGNATSLVGSWLALSDISTVDISSIAVATTAGTPVTLSVAGAIGFIGAAISVAGSLESNPPSGSPGFDTATSCVGGLMGNPTQSAQTINGAEYDAPPPDTMFLSFTPAQLEQMVGASANTTGATGCAPGACNVLDFYPTMTGLGPPKLPCYNRGSNDTIGDQGFPGSGPAFDYGCSSSLKVRLTVTRDWTTGPAVSAKSPDMVAVELPPAQGPVLGIVQNIPNDNQQLTTFLGSKAEGVLFNDFIPLSADLMYRGNIGNGSPAVLSRSPNILDAFFMSGAGLTVASNATSDKSWAVKGFIGTPADGAVTATARSPSNLDVLFDGGDGIYDAYWSAVAGWVSAPYNVTSATCYDANLSASTNSAPCVGSNVPWGGGIASISLNPWNINAFYIGTDGGIWNSFWIGADWSTWEVFGPSSAAQQAAAVAPPGGGIAAVARTSGSIDVYYIGNDGGLWTDSWQANGQGLGWQSWEIPGSAGLGIPGSVISAVARQPGTVDVLFEGSASTNNSIEWASWQSPSQAYQFQSIPGSTGQTPNPRGADAVSLVAPTSYDLWASYVDNQGNLVSMIWHDQCNTNVGGSACNAGPATFPWSPVPPT